MTAVGTFSCAALLCAGQLFGALFHPDPWATLAALLIAFGVAAVLYSFDKGPSC